MGQVVTFPTKKKTQEDVSQKFLGEVMYQDQGSYRVDFVLLAATYHGCVLGDMEVYESLLFLAGQFLQDGAFVEVPVELEQYLTDITYNKVMQAMVELEQLSNMESFSE